MRLLAISSAPPFPPDSALRLRTWHLLRRIEGHAKVCLLTWYTPWSKPPDIQELKRVFSDVIVLPFRDVSISPLSRAYRQLRFVTGAMPPYVQGVLEERGLMRRDGLEALESEIFTRHSQNPFDVVLAEEEAMKLVIPPDLGAKIVLHRLNVFVRAVGDERAQTRLGRLLWLVDKGGWARYDREIMDGVDLMTAPTPESAGEIQRLAPNIPVVVVPSGVDIAPIRTPPSAGGDICFVGWLMYKPNIDAVRWFAKQVFPIVRKRFPETTFRVIGGSPTTEVLALEGDGVHVVGRVDDISRACEGVRLGVTPLRAGMGIKNKTLEYMGMGLPVVATTVGAEGIAAGEENGVFVARDAQEFADRVCALLGDAELADSRGRAAREFTEANLSWDVIARDFLSTLEKLVTSKTSNRVT